MRAVNKLAIAYGAASFSAAALHNLFLIYYVDLFFTIYKLSKEWFYVGEIIYMIWNSINDPLFGWFININTTVACNFAILTV